METTMPKAVYNNDQTLLDVMILRRAREINADRRRLDRASMLNSMIVKGVYKLDPALSLKAEIFDSSKKVVSKKKKKK